MSDGRFMMKLSFHRVSTTRGLEFTCHLRGLFQNSLNPKQVLKTTQRHKNPTYAAQKPCTWSSSTFFSWLFAPPWSDQGKEGIWASSRCRAVSSQESRSFCSLVRMKQLREKKEYSRQLFKEDIPGLYCLQITTCSKKIFSLWCTIRYTFSLLMYVSTTDINNYTRFLVRPMTVIFKDCFLVSR